MTAVMASFLAWLFPSFGVLRKGFDVPEHLDTISILLLSIWYVLIFLSFIFGQELARFMVTTFGLKSSYPPLDSDAVYWSYSLLTAVGTVTTFIKIFRLLSPQMAILFIASGLANRLGEALRQDYSFGLVSLRYVVVFSSSISLYRIIRTKKLSFLNVLNVVMLAMSILLSSRLMFIATVLTTIFLLNYNKPIVRINITKVAVIVVVIFSILSVLNYSRNAGFYQRSGISFWGAGLSEIITYLGSPFQCAVGSAKVLNKLVVGGPDTYRHYVDVEEVLNTNSAFVHLHEQMGFFAWLYIGFMCSFMGFSFSLMRSSGSTAFLLPCGAILYGSAELWRLDLFQQGIFIVWFVCGIGVPLSFLILKQIRIFISKAYPLHQLNTY